MNDSVSLTHEMMEANKIKNGCGCYINARLGIRCGNKNYGALCDECQSKLDAVEKEGEQ